MAWGAAAQRGQAGSSGPPALVARVLGGISEGHRPPSSGSRTEGMGSPEVTAQLPAEGMPMGGEVTACVLLPRLRGSGLFGALRHGGPLARPASQEGMNPLPKLPGMEEVNRGRPAREGAAALQKSLVSSVLPPPSGRKEGNCRGFFRARVGWGSLRALAVPAAVT